jgi:hypothetical protein
MNGRRLPVYKQDKAGLVMELDGSNSRNLTEHPAVDWVYATHGDRMFLVSDRDDEKRKHHLYEAGGDFRWRAMEPFGLPVRLNV